MGRGLGDRGQLGLVFVSQGTTQISDVPNEERGEKGGASGSEGAPEVIKNEVTTEVAPPGAAGQRKIVKQGPQGPGAADRGKVGLRKGCPQGGASNAPRPAPIAGNQGAERGGAKRCVYGAGPPLGV